MFHTWGQIAVQLQVLRYECLAIIHRCRDLLFWLLELQSGRTDLVLEKRYYNLFCSS